MHKRILVHLRMGSADNRVTQLAKFTQSVVDTFEGKNGTASVYVQLRDNQLLLSDTKLPADGCLVQIKRPAFCPIHGLNPGLISQLPAATRDRGIDVGCALILETCDERVLLTRRASHLRTFPGVWVPPGGHIEASETLLDATFRELREETGLDLSLQNCQNQRVSTLALWESSYPPMLSLGLPVRHHIVVYMHTKLCQPMTADYLQTQLRLDPSEVGAATWITHPMAEAIAAAADDAGKADSTETSEKKMIFPDTIQVTVVGEGGKQSVESTSSVNLLNCAPSSGNDIERVSTGTKFALSEWLKASSASCQL